uniref:RNA-dependent RNA polymerase n=1 Tax=Amblyomma sculptum TaxID=1581419 RepID=A0A1E1XN54_AMBSC
MAGSDLDGDEYIVIWQKELFFPGSNRDPMVFSDTSVGAPSTGNLDEDIIRFLCEYILNDSVGIMSNAHLAWADQEESGIFSAKCLQLAEKISVCLDFAKTGISAALTREERPQRYPDFMRKRGTKPTYRSIRVLGELFRLNEALVGSCSLAFTPTDFHTKLFEYPGWQKHRSAAKDAMSTYEWMMQRILDQHGIESEAEVVTGVISSVSRYNKSKQDKTSVETLVAKQYRELVDAMQKCFHRDVEAVCSRDPSQRTEKTQLEMASAWYMVTCTTPNSEEHRLGLPWCITDALLLLLRERSNAASTPMPSPRNLLVAKINNSVRSSDSPSGAALNMLRAWARKENLLQDAVGQVRQICSSCFSQAFQQFLSSRQSEPVMSAAQNASPYCGGDSHVPTAGDLVCGFLRYVCSAPTGLPLCAECSSTQLHKLTLAALYCYSRLVITKDVCCFDLPCDPDLHDSLQEVQESDPIRINVQNSPFLDMVRNQTDTVKELLCRWSGVEEVNIRWHSYRSKRHHYIVVSAVGRQWQLCCFDELMLQPWLQNAIVNRRLA